MHNEDQSQNRSVLKDGIRLTPTPDIEAPGQVKGAGDRDTLLIGTMQHSAAKPANLDEGIQGSPKKNLQLSLNLRQSQYDKKMSSYKHTTPKTVNQSQPPAYITSSSTNMSKLERVKRNINQSNMSGINFNVIARSQQNWQ